MESEKLLEGKKFSFKAWARIGAVNCKSGIFASRPIPE